MKAIQKALKLRDSLSRKDKKTYERFYNELLLPKKMLYLIEGNCKKGALLHDEDLILEARRNYIVSLATAFEIFWREFIRESVDKVEIDKAHFKNKKYSFNELVHILGNKLTLGELIASSFTFQGIDPIQKIAKEVFKFDFLDIFSKAKLNVTIDNVNKTIHGKDILKNKDYIEKCFERRHTIVHDSRNIIKVSKLEIEKTENSMFEFSILGAICWENHIKISN